MSAQWEKLGSRKASTLGMRPGTGDTRDFYHLPEPLLASELARLSFAQRILDTDVITFQPCPNPVAASQDRWLVEDIVINEGEKAWQLRAVFDGHAGDDVAEYVVGVISEQMRIALSKSLARSTSYTKEGLSSVIADTIQAIDDKILTQFLALFPGKGSPEDLEKLSDDEIRAIINDGGVNLHKVHLCMRGTTAVVSLIDPEAKNLWIASLGDSVAAIGVRKRGTEKWDSKIMSSSHAAASPEEAARLRAAHPGEEGAIVQHRVLGSIMITKAIGDFLFKLPRIYTDRVFLNAVPGFRTSRNVQEFIGRNLTPPYMSAAADVRHVSLHDHRENDEEVVLLLASDGLIDLYDPEEKRETDGNYGLDALAKKWVDVIGNNDGQNKALSLLRDSIGGDDTVKVSTFLTLEADERWMDDVTILVQKIL